MEPENALVVTEKALEESVLVAEPINRVPKPGPELAADLLETDFGNASRIKYYYKNDIFYDHIGKTWFYWTGKNWQRDTYQSMTLKVVEAIRKIITVEIPWLEYQQNEKKVEDISIPDPGFVGKSLNRSKIKAACLLAADLMPHPDQLDSHKDLLNCQNGTVNLRSGERLPHDRKDYLTKIVQVAFKEGAKCPRFIAFLERAFPNDPEGIRYLQKIIGYSLTGDVSEKKIFILWGAAGNNGKTLLFNVIRGILGQCFCVQLASESLVSGRVNAIRSDIAKLMGYRFVTASETDRRYKFNEALIKLLTGGDALTARHPHEREFEFTPELKLFIGTNAKPEFTLSDRAMMNRVCIIPFRVSIPPEEQDKQLTQRLITEEGEGILAWAIEGARLWAEEGLGENPFDQDSAVLVHPVITIDQFIADCCTQNPQDQEKTTDLMTAFNRYKEDKGDESPAVNTKMFSNMLKEVGIDSHHSRDGNYRKGIALNAVGRGFLNEPVDEPEIIEASEAPESPAETTTD